MGQLHTPLEHNDQFEKPYGEEGEGEPVKRVNKLNKTKTLKVVEVVCLFVCLF